MEVMRYVALSPQPAPAVVGIAYHASVISPVVRTLLEVARSLET